MALTDLTVRNAKPKERQYKIADEKGMYLLVTKSGKYFRYDYRFKGKRKTLALGAYPKVSLSKARQAHTEARDFVQKGIDPGQKRKQEKLKSQNTFELVARDFIKLKSISEWTENHSKKVTGRLEKDVFPIIGDRPIHEITRPEIRNILEKIVDRGAVDTAHRVKQTCSQIYRYAIVKKEIADNDPTLFLSEILPAIRKQHFPTITEPTKIGELMRAIDGYEGNYIVRYALQLAPLVFVRPGELRNAEWSEFNIDQSEWRIPAHKMKMREQHIVPLSKQARTIIETLQPYSSDSKYLFPSVRTKNRPMSENTINAALRRMGYTKEEFTGHGFRAMASTTLHSKGWKSDVIERQLAHGERNPVKAAYNHAEYLPERIEMMQYWADLLDNLKGNC